LKQAPLSLHSLPTVSWTQVFAQYKRPHAGRGVVEIALSAAPLLILWGLAGWAVKEGWWWAALASVPASFFLVRLFMIQHDCGHGSFFRSKAVNDWVGRVLGVVTLTPYDYWRRSHAIHHGTSGNLDRRDIGAIEMLTVEEYRALPRKKRLLYRLYRHPIVMFGIGPAFVFLLQQRLPVGLMKAGWRPWASVMGTNLALLVAVGVLIWLTGILPLLVIIIPTAVGAATIGVWLFYVQHQYEGVAWSRGETWKAEDAAMRGSSHYDLPQPFRWLTGSIGVHHVHHAQSRVPFYRLDQILKDYPELKTLGRITVWQSFRFAQLALWDEKGGRLVTFKEARAVV